MTEILDLTRDIKAPSSQSALNHHVRLREMPLADQNTCEDLFIENLSVKFRHGGASALAIHDVNYSVRRGETVGIVGESGSGKSVTWLAALGLLPKSAEVQGSVKFGGLDLIKAAEKDLQRVRGQGIGIIFQDPVNSLNPVRMISSQLVEVIRLTRNIDVAAATNEASRLLDQVGIARTRSVLSCYPHELSGGMSQRVMIAMSIAANPSFLVADEPTTALDVTTQAQILKLLDELRRQMNMGLIFISHDLDVVANICSRVIVMERGRVVEDQPTRALFTRPATEITKRLLRAMPTIVSATTIASANDQGLDRLANVGGEKFPLMRLEAVSKIFPIRRSGFQLPWIGRTEHHAAIKNVSLEIAPGTTFGLVGESGSGKSTIGQLALGALSTTTGSIEFNGSPLHTGDVKKRHELRRLIQLIPQNPRGALDRRWTVGAQIEEPLAIFGLERLASARKKQSLAIMERLGLDPNLYDRYPSQLSGGQCQRVVLARALISKPCFLICDEVTSALDVSIQAQVLDLLKELQLQFGLTYLFITHDLRVVSRLADRVAVLHRGSIVEIAAPSTLFTRPLHPYTKQLVQAVPRLAVDNFSPDGGVAFSDFSKRENDTSQASAKLAETATAAMAQSKTIVFKGAGT